MLKVKKMFPWSILPTVAHPGSDLGYDLYAAEDATLNPHVVTAITCGIKMEMTIGDTPAGFLVRDRSSMASKGIRVSAGVIDAGYRGEMKVLLTLDNGVPYEVHKGDKIAQMIPIIPATNETVEEVDELEETARNEKGFGSTGV